MLGRAPVLIALCLAAGTALFAAESQIATSKNHYSVGEAIVITGSGFTPATLVNITVLRPDHLTDVVTPPVSTDQAGAFTATYTPPAIPGRYKITATDGANTANTATTGADAIGYDKGVYNKGTVAPGDTTGVWTTGNAGSNYMENQWAYYQYQVTGVGTGSTPPSFDVAFNHFQSNSNAIFIDALANFRVCVDCELYSGTLVALTGPARGMLSDRVPYPPDDVTYWKAATVSSRLNEANVISAVSEPFVTNSACPAPGPNDATNTPSGDHCFHVSGTALASMFSQALSTDRPDGKPHSITLFYAAHLSATYVWGQGNEALLGCPSSINYVNPYPPTMPSPIAWGTDAYGAHDADGNPIGDACSKTDSGVGSNDWTTAFNGMGSATGSSRHFTIANQSAGSQGDLTLPIPTVAAPSNHIVITKLTSPASAPGVQFSYTGSFGTFVLDTDAGTATPNTTTFNNIAPGVQYTVTEGATSGFTLTSLVCAVTSGTDVGATISAVGATANITLGPTDTNVTVTCTYTNTGQGHIIVDKVTNPSGDPTSFAFTTTGTGYLGFSLTDAAAPNNQALDPGAYSITESAVTGWVLSSRACALTVTGTGASTFPASGTTQPANISLGAGDTVTCTFTNTKPDARITLAPATATNLVGDQHVLTATVQQFAGSGFVSAPAGTLVTFSLLNNTANATFVGGVNTCTTAGTTGQCTVAINATQAGSVNIRATTTFSVLGISFTRTTNDGVSGDSADALKHYVDANITIGPSATNELNHQHIFTVTVTQNADSVAAATSANITPAVTPTPSSMSTTCGAAVAFSGNTATCTITINSTSTGTFTANASATLALGGITVTRSTAGNSGSGGSGPATKKYVDARIALSPLTATNSVTEPHTITATVQQDTGSGFAAAPNGTLVTFSLLNNTANATFVGGVNTCTTTAGACNVQINSTSPGGVNIHATTTFSVSGLTLTRTTGDGLSGDSADAVKHYVDANITIGPSATNELNHQHVFTVTVNQNPDGVAAATSVNITPSVTPTPSSMSSTCGASVAFTGNTATCTITINSTSTGTFTANASATLTLGGITVTRGTAGNSGSGGSGPATKKYVDARIELSPLTATNSVTEPHTITATVQQDTGSGFAAAPYGTLVAFSLLNNTAGAAFVGGVNTCTTTAGACNVQINSTSPGGVNIHATTTFSVSGLTLTRATGDGLSGDSADAVKHYVDAKITIGPSATNEVNHEHVFTVTVTQNADGAAAATSANITPSVTPAPSSMSTTCGAAVAFTGNTATCTITINSTSTGTFTANASATLTVGGIAVTRSTAGNSGSGGSGPATKKYVDARIALSPLSATNSVTDPHTITATVQQDTGSGFAAAPNGTLVTFSLLNNTANATFVGGVNTCTTTAGTCGVQINSTAPGNVDIHATTTFSVSGLTLTRATGDGLSGDSVNANKVYVAGTIIIRKATLPAGGTGFGFAATGGLAAPFTLNDGLNQTYTNQALGSYTVTEGVKTGYDLTNLVCSVSGTGTSATPNLAARTVSITLAAGGSVDCTYTNTQRATLIVTKTTIGGVGTFNYTGSESFSLTTSTAGDAGKVSTTFVVPPGTRIVNETVPSGWVLDAPACSPSAGVTGSDTGVTVTLDPGAVVTCDFVNRKVPTLKIVKNIHGTPATFYYTVTGTDTLNPSVDVPATGGSGTWGPTTINIGDHTISEVNLPVGWTLTDVSCTGYSGGGNGAGTADANGVPTNWNFNATYGDNVVCTYVNSNVQTTRTQGFWATHTALANNVWNGISGLPGATSLGADARLCTANAIATGAQPGGEGTNQLMGGFWAGISQLSKGNKAKRSPLDQARMQMLQQYLAAVLNVHAFGSGSATMLPEARTAYCGTDISAIKDQIGILGTFNTSGDGMAFTPGASATTQESKLEANIPFWDITSH